ncbi:hypothetical protein GLOIN_2v188275 [Rhizophagus irregularis DAOM 181602=DAOM 197198]|uniref:Uncharacterized protein n=1 Tax=Rhizophagus irregularis (strain DAOM 181602 / DAOM 197198 / MUCL 43194) TaxID=747089 RepID=A0A2P4PV45_RHIID|nr:hypothetical protein GLOIN_2v188275 [Rhizophagus irregularis DAOM 181602=DAOM 197198]POG69246.1 hypothetical protein GLOIN_2v188275 [Rhizophagus irregularis DAOM 181602=DAOM 197198]GET63760.1 hypothetical protein GLOIN_2v188275 [Rhizophagus irregularis DAOM 181602=DAOM 197198]|eukprot:XP_025176112.1 hypothetical protein GLOIN_2v188275 [Rhizophagus irregularis DAOM 181602=DAOM 197198]
MYSLYRNFVMYSGKSRFSKWLYLVHKNYCRFGKGYCIYYSLIILIKLGFNALVNDKIGEHIPEQDQMKEAILRKRKERARQFFRIWLIHSINITNLHSLMSFG